MEKVLHQKKGNVVIYFTVVTLTSPVMGVILGGNLTAYLGGYSAKKSVQQTLLFAFLCLLSSIPIPLMNTIWWFLLFLWLLMFFGGAILPSMTGIMLNMVSDDQKTIANSFAYMIFNLIGYLPGPYIYALIDTLANDPKRPDRSNEKAAMFFLMYSSILPVISFSLATFFIFRNNILGWELEDDEESDKGDE